jgi:hypothetical protein
MLKYTALVIVLSAVDLIVASDSAGAEPLTQQTVRAAARQPIVQPVGNGRSRSRSLKLSATQSSGPCGVWQCTWRTGDGGCLVWEKTKCKVINPFD